MGYFIKFYETPDGKKPIEDFFEKLNPKASAKVTWTINVIKKLDIIPVTYLKKLVNSENIWEIRIALGSNIYRIFCFFDTNKLILLTHGLMKKTQKTSIREMQKAEKYRKEYFERK